MGKFRIIVKPKAERDFNALRKSSDLSSVKKLERVIIELSEHPTTGTGKPEPLKQQLSGFGAGASTKKTDLFTRLLKNLRKWL